MKLFYSSASPFARKVVVAAHELALMDRIELAKVNALPTATPPELASVNALGKIPALILEDGSTLADSRVIVEYLDTLGSGRKLLPGSGRERFEVLFRQSLADGALDAAVLRRYEVALRPEALRWSEWIEGQRNKIARSLDVFEGLAPVLMQEPTIVEIAIGCVLGYLDFRFSEDAWRERRPRLANWYEQFASRPSMQATAPS